MTNVKELIEYLSALPEDAEVEICKVDSCKAISLINNISYYKDFNKVTFDPFGSTLYFNKD